MKKLFTASIIATTLTFTGCASIFSGSTQTLTFKSVPDTANISITNKAGEKINTVSTTATVTLKHENDFFHHAK